MKNVAIFLSLVFVAFLTINQEKALANYSKNGCYIVVVQIDETVDLFKEENREASNLALRYLERDFRFVEILKYCEGSPEYKEIEEELKKQNVYLYSGNSSEK